MVVWVSLSTHHSITIVSTRVQNNSHFNVFGAEMKCILSCDCLCSIRLLFVIDNAIHGIKHAMEEIISVGFS